MDTKSPRVDREDSERDETTTRRDARAPGFWEKSGRGIITTASIGLACSFVAWLAWMVVQLYREVGETKKENDALRSEIKADVSNLSEREEQNHQSLEGRLDRLDDRVEGVADRQPRGHRPLHQRHAR